MPLEKSLLDKFVNGAFLGKRKIGRPIKYNIRHKGHQGWVELVFNPRNKAEAYASQALKFIHPYLFWVTYRFHVEKAREGGFRIEDLYSVKFHKEPYVLMHMYSQYFHPHTLLERVRNVAFYRRPRTIYKGFTVPDWAKAENTDGGWEFDFYSQQAWQNMIHDMNAELTPMQFAGDRQEPNILQWFRLEQFGKGASSRLFYNEVPQPTWGRHGGHMLENKDNDRERDRLLYSFTNANQDQPLNLGIDTTTPEGAAEYKREFEVMRQLAPEMIKKDMFFLPHEMPATVSTEPHFQRVWQHYREHTFKESIARAVEGGAISQEDADQCQNFLNMAGQPSVNIYIMAKTGKMTHLEGHEGFQATMRVLEALGVGSIEFDHCSAQPLEEQFWGAYDRVFELSEPEMRKQLPYFVTDPNNRAKVEALLGDNPKSVLGEETTKKLA